MCFDAVAEERYGEGCIVVGKTFQFAPFSPESSINTLQNHKLEAVPPTTTDGGIVNDLIFNYIFIKLSLANITATGVAC